MKRLSILATGLIALGLLFTGSANAMTYNVQGTSTKIAISKKVIGTTIKRCDDCEEEELRVFSGLDTKCERRVDGFDALVCSHYYTGEGPHTVTYDGKGKSFDNFSLNNSNVTSIDNFSTIGDITNIYIKDNTTLTSFDAGIFSWDLDTKTIYLENNNLTSFQGTIPDNVKKLYLNSNELRTIPESIWDLRDIYTIKLSSSKKFPAGGSESYLIDLSDNNINFIKITKIAGIDVSNFESYDHRFNSTTYPFEWFGYSHTNENNLSYDYVILDNNGDTILTGDTTESSVTINDHPLKPGNYTFKVYLHDDDTTNDEISFNVDYDEGITFTSRNPEDGANISSVDNISFSWQRNGAYPSAFVSGYNYTLSKNGTIIDSGSASDGMGSYNLDRSLIENNPTGNYTFTVYLIDKEGNQIKDPASTTFRIRIDNTITINSPALTETDTQNIYFDWDTSTPSTLFGYYDYYITTANACSPSAAAIKSGTPDTKHTTFNYSLENGDYLLCIDMYDSTPSHNKLNSGTINYNFSVRVPATIFITNPIEDENITTEPTVDITWNISLPDPYEFTDYIYTVQKGSEQITGGIITNENDRSFSLNNLHDGTYTISIIMDYDDGSLEGGSVSDTRTFKISSSSEVYIDITPTNGTVITGDHIKQVPVTFSWEGGGSPLISGYSYTLKNTLTSEVIESGTKKFNESLTIGSKLLSSGTYKFEVIMVDSSDKEIIRRHSDVTIVIPSDLEILSPSAGQLTIKDVTFTRTGFAEFEEHYSYQVKSTGSETPIKSGNNTNITSFSIPNMMNGEYTFTVSLLDSSNNPIKTKSRTFSIPDSQTLTLNISDGENSVTTLRSRTGIFSWGGTSENFNSYSYSVEGTTFKNESYSYVGTTGSTAGNFTLNDLSTGRYRFTVTMLDSSNNPITGKYIDFNVVIPATIKITSPANGSKITSSNVTFTRTGYNDTAPRYEYKLTGQPVNSTESTSFTTSLTNGNYTLTVKLYSGNTYVTQDSIDFTVNTSTKPASGGGGGGGGASGKTHYNNNLKLSVGNSSPTTNERIKLIVNIDDKYTGKVSFPKLQYYSPDTQKWIDIPPTSKNYISEYGDEAKLGYVKFTSDDDGRKDISQFVKFSKSGYYRIHAEDKEGYDADVEVYVSAQKTTTTNNTNTTVKASTTTNNNTNVNSIIREFLPEVFEQTDTQEEVYIARSCKRYTITYSDSLKVYTSPNLNTNEYFVSKEYFKRYIDSKNKYQSGCPTNVGWISTNYSDKSNDNTRYTAPNGKVYFITSQNGKYYSNELNKELKTPTSFNSVQELKYYIRDRNPLISMAALGPTK